MRLRPLLLEGAVDGWRNGWLAPFVREAWRFRTVRSRKVVLHYAPELAQDFIPELLLARCNDELRSLERRFGFRLSRVNVFLFSATGPITEMFGPEYGALALPSSKTIVVGDHASVREDVRHELVHLFAARWNYDPPPLLSEGLAVHLQHSRSGYPIGLLVRRFGSRSEWTLRSLLDRKFFFDASYRFACYMIAGSFTGFLIDEFGWDAYRRLYRRCCRPYLVNWAFKRSLGVSFEEAEARWRTVRT
jgi:hypothetical protein